MANAPQNEPPPREAPWLAWLGRTQRSLAEAALLARPAAPEDGKQGLRAA